MLLKAGAFHVAQYVLANIFFVIDLSLFTTTQEVAESDIVFLPKVTIL